MKLPAFASVGLLVAAGLAGCGGSSAASCTPATNPTVSKIEDVAANGVSFGPWFQQHAVSANGTWVASLVTENGSPLVAAWWVPDGTTVFASANAAGQSVTRGIKTNIPTDDAYQQVVVCATNSGVHN